MSDLKIKNDGRHDHIELFGNPIRNVQKCEIKQSENESYATVTLEIIVESFEYEH